MSTNLTEHEKGEFIPKSVREMLRQPDSSFLPYNSFSMHVLGNHTHTLFAHAKLKQ